MMMLSNIEEEPGEEQGGMRAKRKVCLVGDFQVGKTSLVRRFVQGIFREDYMRTLGALLSKKSIEVQGNRGTITLDIMVWDILGDREIVDIIADSYFFKANGLVAVWDITRARTFESLRGWIHSVRSVCGPIPMVMLANKCDLLGNREGSQEASRYLGGQVEAKVLPTSAKTGWNVQEAFAYLGKAMVAPEGGPLQ